MNRWAPAYMGMVEKRQFGWSRGSKRQSEGEQAALLGGEHNNRDHVDHPEHLGLESELLTLRSEVSCKACRTWLHRQSPIYDGLTCDFSSLQWRKSNKHSAATVLRILSFELFWASNMPYDIIYDAGQWQWAPVLSHEITRINIQCSTVYCVPSVCYMFCFVCFFSIPSCLQNIHLCLLLLMRRGR